MKDKILIVDDMKINREILKEVLCDKFEIYEASDGKQALDTIDEGHEFAVILLDIMMPVMNGFEVLEELNKRHYTDRTPVLVISGETSVDSEERCLASGASDFIRKPFNDLIVDRRVCNTADLYNYKKGLEDKVEDGPMYSIGFMLSAVTIYSFNVTAQREDYLQAMVNVESDHFNRIIAGLSEDFRMVCYVNTDTGVYRNYGTGTKRDNVSNMLNGYEATEAIRHLGEPFTSQMPIVAMTANVSKEDVARAYEAGMSDYLSKPINPQEFVKMLCRSLSE